MQIFVKTSNWKDNYPGSGSVRHNRERKGENSRQGRYVLLFYFASVFNTILKHLKSKFTTIELCFINRDSTRPTASNLRWKTT